MVGCGSSDSETTPESQSKDQVEQQPQQSAAAEERKAKQIGELVQKAREKQAREAQKNLEKYQSGAKKCPPGQGYVADLDICL